MKKIRLIGMFALTFALVFGAASCKNDEDEGPWGDSLADVLKEEGDKILKADWIFDKDAAEIEVTYYLDGEEIDPKYSYNDAAYVLSHYPKEVSKDEAVDFFKMYVAEEKDINKYYKDGPVKYGDEDATQYLEMSVMINGDRDVIRIEMTQEMAGKLDGIPAEEDSFVAVEYKKK